jgi:putative transposase
MTFDPNIHNRQSIRLKGYDYSKPGSYFITICVQNQKCIFGEIVEEKMVLNNFGNLISNCWLSLPKRFSRLILDQHIIMPNHLHGILNIEKNNLSKDTTATEIKNPLSNIIKCFKNETTVKINQLRKNDFNKLWQRNYYEHIIRDRDDLIFTRDYIINNPKNWKSDELYL